MKLDYNHTWHGTALKKEKKTKNISTLVAYGAEMLKKQKFN